MLVIFMNPRHNFRQIYCTQNAISEAEYFEHILRRTLPPHGRAFWAFSKLTLQYKNHFRADYDFLNDVGRLCRYCDLSQSVDEFISHPWNQRGLLRWVLRLRVSTSRVRRILREQFKEASALNKASATSTAPLAVETDAPSAATTPDSTLSDQAKTEIKTRLDQIDQAKEEIKSRLEQIDRAHTRVLPVKTAESQAAPVEFAPSPTLGSAETPRFTPYGRPWNSKPRRSSAETTQTAELDVLRVANERLKGELAKITAQRDILKKAAAILASSD